MTVTGVLWETGVEVDSSSMTQRKEPLEEANRPVKVPPVTVTEAAR